MFESIVTGFINRILGDYIDNLELNQLNVAIWNGDLTLRHLKLKRSALDGLQLPVAIVEGYLEELVVKIPWHNLKTKPVQILINKLFLLLGPRFEQDEHQVDEAEAQKIKEQLWRDKIQKLETLDRENISPKNASFLQSLVTKMIDNLQFSIRDIHVRYEDRKGPFSVGLTLAVLAARSTDEEWKETWIHDTTSAIRKLLDLDGLSIYWNSQEKESECSMRELDQTEISAFLNYFASRMPERRSTHQYILKPISGIGKLTIHKYSQEQRQSAKHILDLSFDEIGFVLNDQQFADMIHLTDQYANYRCSQAILEELKKLEMKISLEDLKFYRSIARSIVKKERGQSQTPSSGSFLGGWLTGWMFHAQSMDSEEAPDSSSLAEDLADQLTPVELQSLYDTIDYVPGHATQGIAATGAAISNNVRFSLNTGSFCIQYGVGKSALKLIDFRFIGLAANIIQSPSPGSGQSGYWKFVLHLDDLLASEGYYDKSLFPTLVKSKPWKRAVAESSDGSPTFHQVLGEQNLDKFFYFSYESGLDLSANPSQDALVLRMKPLEIVLNKQVINHITEFFLRSPAQLITAASEKIEEIKVATRASLELALLTHSAINVSVDLQAPIILFPFSVTDPESSLYLLDLGSLTIHSDLVSAAEKAKIQKRNFADADSDVTQLEAMLYDRFKMNLNQLQILYTRRLADYVDSNAKEGAANFSNLNYVVKPIDLKVNLASCILSNPAAASLTNFKIHAEFEDLKLVFSDDKWQRLIYLLDIFFPEEAAEEPKGGPSSFLDSISKTLEPERHGEESTFTAGNHRQVDMQAAFSFGLGPEATYADAREPSMASENGKDSESFFDASESLPESRPASVNVLETASSCPINLAATPCSSLSQSALHLEHKKLEIVLKIGEIACVVDEIDQSGKEQTIGNIILQSMDFCLQKKAQSLALCMTLSSFLISTADGLPIVESNRSTQLLAFDLVRLDTKHPSFSKESQTRIKLLLSKVDAYCEPNTIQRLYQYVMATFDSDSREAKAGPSTKASSDLKRMEEKKKPLGLAKSLGEETLGLLAGSLDMSITIDRVLFHLIENDSHASFSMLSLDQGELKFLLFPSSLASSGAGSEGSNKKRISGKLAKCTISSVDENSRIKSNEPPFICFEGDNVVDFEYETFADEESKDMDARLLPLASSCERVKMNCGSLVLCFDRELCGQLFAYIKCLSSALSSASLSDFRKEMAREQKEDKEAKQTPFYYRIFLLTPIILLPRPAKSPSLIVARLGSINLENGYPSEREAHLQLAIRKISLSIATSLTAWRVTEKLLLGHMDLDLDIRLLREQVMISGSMSPIVGTIDVKQYEIVFERIFYTSDALQSIFATSKNEVDQRPSLKASGLSLSSQPPAIDTMSLNVELESEIALKLELAIEHVSLNLLEDGSDASFCVFDCRTVKLVWMSRKDETADLNAYIRRVDIRDTREGRTRDLFFKPKASLAAQAEEDLLLTKIAASDSKLLCSSSTKDELKPSPLPFSKSESMLEQEQKAKRRDLEDEDQCVTRYSKLKSGQTMLQSTLTEAQFILLPDHLLAIYSFLILGLPPAEEPPADSLYVSVNLIDLEAYLLDEALLTDGRGEAVRLFTKKLEFASHSNLILALSKVSLSFVQINHLWTSQDSCVEIAEGGGIEFVDPFDVSLNIERESSSQKLLNQGLLYVSPVMVHCSYQDINLLASIFNKISTLEPIRVSKDAVGSDAAAADKRPSYSTSKAITKIDISCSVLSISLIDDASSVYLPILEALVENINGLYVSESSGLASSWNCSSGFRVRCNYFNVGTSAWEPIVEPWTAKLDAVVEFESALSITLSSKERLELTLSYAFLSLYKSLILSISANPRRKRSGYASIERSAPYLIRNQSGYQALLWSVDDTARKPKAQKPCSGSSSDSGSEMITLPSGSQVGWAFEDWRAARLGHASPQLRHRLCVHFVDGLAWESLRSIPVYQASHRVYPLRPRLNSVSHRLFVDVYLDPIQKLKTVLIDSPLMIYNHTDLAIEVMAVGQGSDSSALVGGPWVLAARNTPIGIPMDMAYRCCLKLRPADRPGYAWSQTSLNWRLWPKSDIEVTCWPSLHSDALPFIVHACAQPRYEDHASLKVRDYPCLDWHLTAPLSITNLIPYEFTYRLIDKTSQVSFMGHIESQACLPLYYVSLQHLLGLSIEVKTASRTGAYVSKEVAVLNSPDPAFIDEELVVHDSEGLPLALHMKFEPYESGISKKSVRVSLYCPYLIYNKTGLLLTYKQSTFLSAGKVAGQANRKSPASAAAAGLESSQCATQTTSSHADGSSQPFLFSYTNFHLLKNRACLKVCDSEWSKPISFEAVGSIHQLTVRSPCDHAHACYQLGYSVKMQGMSKMVTITPRYQLYNHFKNESFAIRAGRSEDSVNIIEPAMSLPYHPDEFMAVSLKRMNSEMDEWSASFDLSQIGAFYLQLRRRDAKPSQSTSLGLPSLGQANNAAPASDLAACSSASKPELELELEPEPEPRPEPDAMILLVRVEIVLRQSSIYCLIQPATRWPYVLINKSHVNLTIYQKECRGRIYNLPSGSCLNWSWESPCMAHKALVVNLVGRHKSLDLSQIGPQKPIRFSEPETKKKYLLIIEIIAVGVSLFHVVFTSESFDKRKKSLRSQHSDRASAYSASFSDTESTVSGLEDEEGNHSEEGRQAKDRESSVGSSVLSASTASLFESKLVFEAQLSLAGFGVSLVDKDCEELLYMNGSDLNIAHRQSTLHSTYGLGLAWCQIDNQTSDCESPMLLYPTNLKKDEKERLPLLKIGLIQSFNNAQQQHDMLWFPYFGLLLQEISVDLDEILLQKLMAWFSILSAGSKKNDPCSTSDPATAMQELAFESGAQLYFEIFQLHPIKINLTFVQVSRPSTSAPLSAVAQCQQQQGGNRCSASTSSNSGGSDPISFLTKVLTMAMGNVSDAPLVFNALVLSHPIISATVLAKLIQQHYSQQAIQQLHKLIGSADFLGNPIGLFNSFSSGVADLFYEPYQGFVSDRPQDFGLGIAKGSASLLKKSVGGLTSSLSKFTESLGKGLSLTTLDPDYIKARREGQRKKNQPRHALSGVGLGTQNLLKSVASGLTGIVEMPSQGAKAEGVGGFFKGLGKGLVGVVTKPVVGVFDMATSVTQGIKNTATLGSEYSLDSPDALGRSRLPRVKPYDGILRDYSEREAIGQYYLREYDHAKYAKYLYVAHLEISKPEAIGLSSREKTNTLREAGLVLVHHEGLLFIHIKSKGGLSHLIWQLDFEHLIRVSRGLNFLRLDERSESRRYLEISNEATKDWLASRIEEAFEAYNNVHRTLD